MIQVIVKNTLRVIGELPVDVSKYLIKRLTFTNPKYEDAKRQRRFTNNIAVELTFIKKTKSGLILSRGFAAQLIQILRYHNISYQLDDQTRILPDVSFTFSGKLYSFQQQAVSSIIARRFGVLNSPTGSGKTVMTLYVIAHRQQPTLIVCHTKKLMYQWRDRIVEFLGLKQEDVLKEATEAGVCLVLSDRKTHCQYLYERILRKGVAVQLMTGSVSKKKRTEIVRELELGMVKILVATGSLIGEGFDCKTLRSLFMTTPVKFTGRVIQYLGRILRTAEGKLQPRVYDYLDKPGVLQHSFKSRCHAYESMGVIVESIEKR